MYSFLFQVNMSTSVVVVFVVVFCQGTSNSHWQGVFSPANHKRTKTIHVLSLRWLLFGISNLRQRHSLLKIILKFGMHLLRVTEKSPIITVFRSNIWNWQQQIRNAEQDISIRLTSVVMWDVINVIAALYYYVIIIMAGHQFVFEPTRLSKSAEGVNKGLVIM